MNKIVNFVFINLVLSCCEPNIGLVYRKVAERNCLRGERYRCVKRVCLMQITTLGHPIGNKI